MNGNTLFIVILTGILLLNIYTLRISIENLTLTSDERENDTESIIKILDIRQKVTEGFRSSFQRDFNLDNKVDMMYDNMTEMIKNLSSNRKS